MKRKKAGRKTTKKTAGRTDAEQVSAMLERNLIDVLKDHPAAPGDHFWECPDGGIVDGISLPADLDAVAFLVATLRSLEVITIGQGSPDGEDKRISALFDSLKVAYRAGFAMAVRVYAADLKNAPRVASICDALARGRRIGAETNKRKAEPTRTAIRKRFQELRKTITKKTVRYLRVAEEFEMSERHVQRIVDGID